MDFDDEARKLWNRLNIDPNTTRCVSSVCMSLSCRSILLLLTSLSFSPFITHPFRPGQWNPMDPIWRHPEGGGTVYVGNQTAAASLELLQQRGITRVVNCTTGSSQIPNFHEQSGLLKYYRFSVRELPTLPSSSHPLTVCLYVCVFSLSVGVDQPMADACE